MTRSRTNLILDCRDNEENAEMIRAANSENPVSAGYLSTHTRFIWTNEMEAHVFELEGITGVIETQNGFFKTLVYA